jgi:putative ABC transport system ATP-binding protein
MSEPVIAATGVTKRYQDGERRIQAVAGVIFQDLALIPGMSVLENLLLPLAPLGGATAAHRRRALDLLDRFGLATRTSTTTERLSGGERQRAALARALILSPPILLLDEPTAHLDRDNARTVLDHLVGLRQEGHTIVVATHDPRITDDPRVDRTLALTDGKLSA